jgi:hypothetical protein
MISQIEQFRDIAITLARSVEHNRRNRDRPLGAR